MFVSLRGRPRFCYSDLGSQLTKAGKFTKDPDEAQFNIKKIQRATSRQGITWKHAPGHSQWRDGSSEAVVKMLKSTLHHMTKSGVPTYDEMLSLLTQAADVLNQRPLGVQHHQGSTPGYCPVTPNLLLMGSRSEASGLDVDTETSEKYLRRYKFLSDCFDCWWKQWYNQVFPSLVPVRKWRRKTRDIQVGDIVLVKFATNQTTDPYRMGKVVKADKDRDGLVRTVSVGMRPRDSREKVLPYKAKELWITAVSAQRIVVICPVEELDPIDRLAKEVAESQHRCEDADLIEYGFDTVP